MTTHKILLIEDDRDTRARVDDLLRTEGFDVLICSAADAAVEIVNNHDVGVALVGMLMRGRDGLEIVRDLRRNTGAGIIVLGRSNDEIDVALALEMGADDYVGRPIRPRELCARIRTLLQRIVAPPVQAGSARPVSDPAVRRLGDLEIFGVIREVRVGGQLVKLTTMEFEVLMVLAANTNAVMSRQRIISAVRGHGWAVNDRSVDGIVSRLRHKLFGGDDEGKHIRTVRGRGYMLRDVTG